MKYCPKCKLRMAAEASVCKQCGGALRTVGEAPAAEAGSAAQSPGADLTMQLQGLQHEVRRSQVRLFVAGALTLLLGALFVALLVGRHLSEVLEFAEVDQLDVYVPPGSPGEAEIKLVRRNSGKVEFVRETAGRTETLIDHGYSVFDPQSAEKQFVWSGGDGDFKIRVRVRDGWRTREKGWIASSGKIQPAE